MKLGVLLALLGDFFWPIQEHGHNSASQWTAVTSGVLIRRGWLCFPLWVSACGHARVAVKGSVSSP